MITNNEENAELIINYYNYPENSERNYQLLRHGIETEMLHHNKSIVKKLELSNFLEINRVKDLELNIKNILPKWIIQYPIFDRINIPIKENTMIESIKVDKNIQIEIHQQKIDINKSCKINFPIGLLGYTEYSVYGKNATMIVVYRKIPNRILFKLKKKHLVCMINGVDWHIVNGRLIPCN